MVTIELTEHSVNVRVDKHEERRLLTGVHIVADVVCNICETVLGWKYVRGGSLFLRSAADGD